MTLTEAKLTYPWDGVQFVATDPKTGEIFSIKKVDRDNTVVTSTEDAHSYYENLNAEAKVENGEKKINKSIEKLIEMENWDWKVLRSLDTNYNF